MSRISRLDVEQIRFSDINEPRVVAFFTGNGGGTKLLHSFMDGHPELYCIPAYPLLYFYPHWNTWEQEMKDKWSWPAIIDIFCERHASVIDSRRIRAANGLEDLGEDQNDHIEIDEELFRSYLATMLEHEEIKRRTFLLAVQYAYALCKGEDISRKSTFFWHHHVVQHLDDMVADFPDVIVLAMIRDPRAKLDRNFDFMTREDDLKLNATDSMLHRSRKSYNANDQIIGNLPKLGSHVNPDRVHLIRHEDLALQLEETMVRLSRLMGIEYRDSMLESTYDGKLWWGHSIYNMPPVNGPYARVLSKDWQDSNAWSDMFVMEGIYRGFLEKYDYGLLYYRRDSWWSRALVSLAILWPLRIEWRVLAFYLNPRTHIRFLRTSIDESAGRIPLKDYTWSATYRYKWAYDGLQLWRSRWRARFLAFANNLSRDGTGRLVRPTMVGLARAYYVAGRYMCFWFATITYPRYIFKRWRLYYVTFWKQIRGRTFLPHKVG